MSVEIKLIPSSQIIFDNITFTQITGFKRYYVSKCAKIYSTCINKLMFINHTFFMNNNKYVSVKLINDQNISKGVKLHRLVAETFIPKPITKNKLTVDHINKYKYDNNVDNLRWATANEQIKNSNFKPPLTTKKIKVHNVNGTCDIFNSIKEASEHLDIKYQTLTRYLSGNIKNPLNIKFEYVKENIDNLPDEIWKVLILNDMDTKYQVSNMGRIKNNNKLLKVYSSQDYECVSLTINNRSISRAVHRLVGLTFLDKIEGKTQIDHINRNKKDNKLINLRWADRKDQGRNMKSNRTILQFDLEGNFIQEFKTISIAVDYIEKENNRKKSAYSGIVSVCRGTHKTSRGFIWKYK